MAYIGKPIGVRNLTFFPLIKDDSTGAEYGAGVKVARAIAVTLSPEFASTLLESDDSVEDEVSILTGFEVGIDASQLDDTVRSKLFGHTLDDKGGMTIAQNDAPLEGAVAFKALLSKQGGANKFVYIVLYKGKFAEFEEKFETLKKGAVTYQTHGGIKGKFSVREHDGKIMYRMREDTPNADAAVIAAWFTSPQTGE